MATGLPFPFATPTPTPSPTAAQLRDRIRTLKQRDLAGLFPRNSTPLTLAEAQPDADAAKA
jgi:hypothetical protein